MKPKISIIVPVYNVEKYIEKCVNSILKQTIKNFELILIDDGSTDSSGLICDKIATNDNRIRVIHKENNGLSSARNIGIDNASGEYIGFVDSDDWIEDDMYEYLLNLLNKNDSDIAVCGVNIVYEEEIECYSDFEDKEKILEKKEFMKNILEDKIKSYAWNKLYKKKLFDKIRYPNGKNMEDVSTTYKLFDKCQLIVCGNQKKYNYLQRSGSILKSKNKKYYMDYYSILVERYKFYNKNYAFLNYTNKYVIFNYIMMMYLIKDNEITKYIEENNALNVLNETLEVINKKKDIIKLNVFNVNKRIYRFLFRRYLKWIKKLTPEDII